VICFQSNIEGFKQFCNSIIYKQIWVKLLMGDNNLNNIVKVYFLIVQNHIEETKIYNSSKIEYIFYTIKISLLKI